MLMVQISIRHGERLLSRRVRDVHWSIDVDARPRRRTIAQNGNLRLRRQVLRTFRNYAKEDFALGTASNKSLAMSKRRWSCLAAQRHGRSHDLPAYSSTRRGSPRMLVVSNRILKEQARLNFLKTSHPSSRAENWMNSIREF